MQKPFSTQPVLFFSTADLEHPIPSKEIEKHLNVFLSTAYVQALIQQAVTHSIFIVSF